MLLKIEKLFPLVIVLVCVLAVIQPALFLWVKPHIPLFLGIIMFCVGLTLNSNDFTNVFKLRWQILGLAFLKYLLMPLLAFAIALALRLPSSDFIGLMIISACPGGTAAAVMSYLSRSNVALTVVLTFVTTLCSPLITPLIIYVFLHKYVPIALGAMIATIFWVVLLPLLGGLVLRKLLVRGVVRIKSALPVVAMIAIILIIGCVVAMNKQNILALPILVGLAVLLNNLLGLALGYVIAKKVYKLNAESCRSVAFEFGILDTGMAVMLATKFFGPAMALCGALYSAIQNLTGALLVRIMRNK